MLWGCYVGHFALDAMWRGRNPLIVFWPLLGAFPPPAYGPFLSWATLWNVAGEVAGLIVLIRLGLFDRPRRDAFLRSGRLG